MEPTKRYEIKPIWAREKGIPATFVAIATRKTEKAIQLTGQGTLDARGQCVICGRPLTHPVSVLTGIGPECGKHGWDESVLGPYGFTEAHAEKLRQMALNVRFKDVWLPRSAIKSIEDTDEVVQIEEEKEEEKVPEIKRACLNGSQIEIRFPFDIKTVAEVKTKIEGRRWEPNQKIWKAPATLNNAKMLKELEYQIDEGLEKLISGKVESSLSKINWPDFPEFKDLYPFQKESIEFVQARGGNAILGDSMGLGKSIEAIAWTWINKAYPALIIVPASVKLKWKSEHAKWIKHHNLNIYIAYGKKPSKEDIQESKKADVVIINYDIIGNKMEEKINRETGKKKMVEIRWTGWVDYLNKEKSWKTIITDECHRWKNDKIGRTIAIKRLSRQKSVKYFIPISGTVIKNRPIEGWNAISIVAPGRFTRWQYVQRFCDAHHNGFGWNYDGASNTHELYEFLKTIMVRHEKTEVMPDLPSKIRSIVPIELKNRKEYDIAEKDFIAYLNKIDPEKATKAEKAKGLTKISLMKNLCIKGKINNAIEWIKDFLETENKLIVFCTHQHPIDQLMKAFKNEAVKIDGSVSLAQREIAKNSFQNDPAIKLFVGNTQAAGEGIELTASSFAAFLELSDTPGDHDQAEDRCYGRLNDCHGATFYYLMADNTIEIQLAAMLDRKRKVIDSVLDGVDTDQESLLSELLNIYREE